MKIAKQTPEKIRVTRGEKGVGFALDNGGFTRKWGFALGNRVFALGNRAFSSKMGFYL